MFFSVAVVISMDIRLDRSIPLSLAEQIKGQILYAISYGHLRPGQALPSVRGLASRLRVAPMTIAQVYRELAQAGLVTTRPGAGTFVADITQAESAAPRRAARDALAQLASVYVRQAAALGCTTGEIRDAVLRYLPPSSANGQSPLVLVIGNFTPATAAYAREIESILSDLNIRVAPLLLQDLQRGGPAGFEDLLKAATLVITVPPRLQEVRALLDIRYCPVAAVAFNVSDVTRRRLAVISPAQRVGIVSTYPEFLPTILDNVASYALLRTPPATAILSQDERVRQMLDEIDVLIYASGSEAVCDRLPAGVEAIEYRHSPEPDSVNRLRPLLARAAGEGQGAYNLKEVEAE